MPDEFHRDVEALYALATASENLSAFMPALGEMLGRNRDALWDITDAYRLVATDSGYTYAFALQGGTFSLLSPSDPVDVTVTGKETNLLAIFQRTLNPMTAMLLKKVRVDGSKAALLKLSTLL